jgi:hypothetical protein
MIDGVLHVWCDLCENAVPSRCQSEALLPDEGLSITLAGWYGGFTDTLFDPPDEQIVCHDCALKIWRMFPNLREQRGLHSTREVAVCCEFHWTFGYDENGQIDRTIYGDGYSRKHKNHMHDPDAPLVKE